jgi:WD40 repeat protein
MRHIVLITSLLLLTACSAAPPPAAPTATVAPTAAAAAPTAEGLGPEATTAPTQAAPADTATAAPAPTATGSPQLALDPTATPPLPDALIDAATAARLAPLREFGLGGAYSPIFAPDGQHLIVGTSAGLAWLRLPGLTPARLDAVGAAFELAISQDGSLLAHGVDDPQNRERTALRRASDGTLLAEVDGRMPAFSPDGSAFATTALPYTDVTGTWLWSADGAPIAELQGEAPVWSPDGRLVATSEEPFEAPAITRVYAADGSGPLLELAGAAPAFSPDSALIAIAAEGQVELHATSDGALAGAVPMPGESVQGEAVSKFSADGSRLLVVGDTGSGSLVYDLTVWDIAAGREVGVFPTLEDDDLIFSSDSLFSPAGDALATQKQYPGDCAPGGVRVIATDDGQVLYDDNESYAAAFSLDGSRVAMRPGTSVRLVELGSGATIELDFAEYTAIAFSPEGATLAAAGFASDGSGRYGIQVELWDVITNQRRAVLATNPDDFVFNLRVLRYSSDGSRLSALVSYGCTAVGFNKVITWDLGSGEVVSEIGDVPSALDEGGAPIDGAPAVFAIAPGGERAAWVADDAVVLRGADGANTTLAPPGLPTALDFSPDGARLAVGDETGVVTLYTLATGASSGLSMGEGQVAPVVNLAFSADGQQLAGQANDGAVVVWGADGATIARLQGSKASESLALSADKRLLLAHGPDGTILYDLAGGAEIGRLDGAASAAALGPGRRIIATLQGGRVIYWGVR